MKIEEANSQERMTEINEITNLNEISTASHEDSDERHSQESAAGITAGTVEMLRAVTEEVRSRVDILPVLPHLLG